MLSRDQILSVVDFEYTTFFVKQWDGEIRLRGLTARERDDFEARVGQEKDFTNFRARFIVKCMVDADGVPLFKDKDANALGDKNAEAVNDIFDEVRKLSGMSDGDMEELEKNSETTP